nr:MAG TPA: hypothetical protein [Caudoviricetes sp.]
MVSFFISHLLNGYLVGSANNFPFFTPSQLGYLKYDCICAILTWAHSKYKSYCS